MGWDTPLPMCSPLPDSGLKGVHPPASMKTSLTAAGGGGLHPPSFWSSPFSITPRGERSPWLPLEMRPDSPGEPGGLPSMGSHRVGHD